MDVDRILQTEGYNLRSVSRLAVRDDTWARIWLEGMDHLYAIYHLLRNTRIVSRKEFYETAFVLDRLTEELREATSLWELGAGHGMLGQFACVLHRGLSETVLVDRRQPPSYERIRERVALAYPFVKTRTRFVEGEIDDALGIPKTGLVVGVHACGALTDRVAETARHSGANFAVVPCCESRHQLPDHIRQSTPRGETEDTVNLWRVKRWRSWGYDVEERAIPIEVTARTRLFVGRAPS